MQWRKKFGWSVMVLGVLGFAWPMPVFGDPYFVIESETDWNEAMAIGEVEPVHPSEWSDYMLQWQMFQEEGEPYPEHTFLPAYPPDGELYVYGGGGTGGTDPEDAGLVMVWGDESTPHGEYASAWKYVYGADPDLTNCTITVTVTAPVFINVISFGIRDINGNIRSWYWNVGAAGPILPNVPTAVTINTSLTGVGATTPTASAYMNNPAFDLTQSLAFIFDENSSWVGDVGVPAPGSGMIASWNYWHNISVLPFQGIIKWDQPPAYSDESPYPDCFWGWDQFSVYGDYEIVADDWLCEDDRPITDIHWWGSYMDWNFEEPPLVAPDMFHIGIWTDVPATSNGFSHPDVMIWEWWVPRSELYERWVGCDYHWDMPGPDACFRYDFFIPEAEWFYQEPGPTVYWISIAADYAGVLFDYPWGWKTREHFFNDDAVMIYDPTAPTVGSMYMDGWPVHDSQEVSWDMAFVLTTDREIVLEPKWSQLPHAASNGFDAASVLWLHPEEHEIKWEQLPNTNGIAYHAHDYNAAPDTLRLVLANDWLCEGGEVTDFHWWGTFEDPPGSALQGFQLSIHDDSAACLPMEPAIWEQDVPIAQITVTDTGMTNSNNERIYRYDYILPDPFPQEQGLRYWFNVCALSSDPGDPCLWKWQETTPIMLCPSASKTVPPYPGQWWSFDDVDLAFRVTSMPVQQEEVNKVVADDFISDGRPIEAVRWWGSYLDDWFIPPATEPYIIDGWIVSFHHTDPVVNPECPPDLLAGDLHPTVLGLYFAPRNAVEIVSMGYFDCMNHEVFEYYVDLAQCCLLCAETDPRDGDTPAEPDAFREVADFGYWLDIQAIVGAEWVPPDCQMTFTSHIPSEHTANRHFWGWHTSYEHQLMDACTGRIVDFGPYPPDCWDYGDWFKQPWLCPSPGEPVNMSFELLTSILEPTCYCRDVNCDGFIDSLDLGAVKNPANWLLPVPPAANPLADVNRDGIVDALDLGAIKNPIYWMTNPHPGGCTCSNYTPDYTIDCPME